MTRIIRTETRKRGFFGKLFKALFILFNVLMAAWLWAYIANVAPQADNAVSQAARAGTQAGMTIGIAILAMLWLAGAVVLGLFTMMTRGRVTLIEERIEGAQTERREPKF